MKLEIIKNKVCIKKKNLMKIRIDITFHLIMNNNNKEKFKKTLIEYKKFDKVSRFLIEEVIEMKLLQIKKLFFVNITLNNI